ncbi:unnamed protein product [Ectocarpus sp. CCAP 1310/34]|nr:unnamed protein product [Ectocarpus sp. CCAP 1310/34]
MLVCSVVGCVGLGGCVCGISLCPLRFCDPRVSSGACHATSPPSARRAIISLPLATLRELQKLAALKAKGVILERQDEVIKKHVKEGNSLSSEDWEAFDLAWYLRSSGVFSGEEWTTQFDGDISGIIKSARPTLSDDAAASSASGKRSADG